MNNNDDVDIEICLGTAFSLISLLAARTLESVSFSLTNMRLKQVCGCGSMNPFVNKLQGGIERPLFSMHPLL
jgi:hypothetical protein